DNEILNLRGGRVGGRLLDPAVRDTDGLAPVVIVGFVPGIIGAKAHQALRQGPAVDVQVFGPVIAGELQVYSGSPEIGAGPVGASHPCAEASVGPLAVVGVAAALPEAQSVDLARGKRGIVEVGDGGTAGPRRAGNELEVGAAQRALRNDTHVQTLRERGQG